jgi:radical SAM superfamily enzyme YgiQ (UPF0313 family)
MRVTLVGADNEENLGLAMLAASLVQAGHQVEVVPFDEDSDVEWTLGRVAESHPRLVGLAMQFQYRARGFLVLASRIRKRLECVHVTCGGPHATLAWAETLAAEPAVDSVVIHEGERTIVELAAVLEEGGDLARVAGLGLRDGRGRALRTAQRALAQDLDALPFAHRYRPPTRHLGVPFIPMTGSRGCWGSCAFCSIASAYRDAKARGGGRVLRMRSPESIAEEMAVLWRAHRGPCVFCFHDDTLLLPRPEATLARLWELRERLDDRGVGDVGIAGKARPDTLTPDFAAALRRLGVVRLFVGIENASQRGQDHLDRRTRSADLHRALEACRAAGIFVCYNLLVFEPDARVSDLRDNVAFMRRHAATPANFCRAEPYHGTPLQRRMAARGALTGDHLGYSYRIVDDRVELAFRITSAVLDRRLHDPHGVANRIMGLAYTAQLLRCFYDAASPRARDVLERIEGLVRETSLDGADLLERIVDLAESAHPGRRDVVERETAELALEAAARDRALQARMDELAGAMEGLAVRGARARHARTQPKTAFHGVALAGLLAASVPGCGGSVIRDGSTSDQDGGAGGSHVVSGDGGAPPMGGSKGGGYVYFDGDSSPGGGWFGEGTGGAAGWFPEGVDAGPTGGIPDAGPADVRPEDGVDSPSDVAPRDGETTSSIDRDATEHFTNTTPACAVRTRDLPLFDPPLVRLDFVGSDGGVRLRLRSSAPAASMQWDADGRLDVVGDEALWYPASDADRVSVVVRTPGGVSVASLSARAVHAS